MFVAGTFSLALQMESEKSKERLIFEESLDEWRPILQKMYELRVEYHHFMTQEDRKEAIFQEYEKLFKESERLNDLVIKNASLSFIKNPRDNQDLDRFIRNVLDHYFKSDMYEESLNLAGYLMNEKLENFFVFRTAAFSALFSNDFQTAEEMGNRLKELGILNNFEYNQSEYKNLEYWKEEWSRESRLRERERMLADLPRVILKTTKGEIEIELFENEAPNTVANFIFLVEKGFYTNLDFHRVIPFFMAQGGGHELLKNEVNMDGTLKKRGNGGPGYSIKDELGPNSRKHFRGAVSMANINEPNTNGSQFFIMYRPKVELDGKHTVFGRVIRGMDVVCRLYKRDMEPQDEKPGIEMPDKILSASVVRKRNHAYSPVIYKYAPNQRPPFPKMPGMEDKPGDIYSDNWDPLEEIRRGMP